MQKNFCDKCQKEITDLRDALHFAFFEKGMVAINGEFQNNFVKQERLLCGECKNKLLEFLKK